MALRLSRSGFQAYTRCARRLWLQAHAPGEASRNEMGELNGQRARAFREAVRQCFPGGRLIEARDTDEAIAQTHALIADSVVAAPARKPLFGAAFAHRGFAVRTDVLEPLPDGTWSLVSLRSAASREDQPPAAHHVHDAAAQAWVLRREGVALTRVELGQPDRRFVLPADDRLDGLLHRLDVTPLADASDEGIGPCVANALDVLARDAAPPIEIGAQCRQSHACEFVRFCTGARLRAGERCIVPVWHLASEPTAKRVAALMADGYRDLAQVPEHRLEKPMHRAMRDVARTGEAHVDPRLREHLRAQPFPRHFLDFETSNAPLPLWRGTSPGERVAFQFSLHTWTREGGPVEHHAFLADTRDDPRPQLARALALAATAPGPVYAWNGASVEGPIAQDLARRCPEHRETLERIARSCRENDLLKPFREWLYHPAMEGSWGLKAVARAMFDGRSPYGALRIANGVDAMREYEAFLSMPSGEERDRTREDLLAYCKADTDTMIRVWRALAH